MPFLSNKRDIFYFGLLLTAATGWFSVGYHHPDEHYQILEFAKCKLGEAPYADLPWEYREQMRPGLQPFMAYCAISFFNFIGVDDPFTQIALIRMLAGMLAFLVYWKWCDALQPVLGRHTRLLRWSLILFWMFPYVNVRFSSENMSAAAFFGALLLMYPDAAQKPKRNLVWAGALFCLSFFFRYQIAFGCIGLGAWLLYRHRIMWSGWLSLLAGALLALVPCLFLDYWLYGEWVFAPYNYFAQNIVEGKAAGFGVEPWYWYFTEMPIFLLPPVSLFVFWYMGAGIRKAPMDVFVWCLVPFVLGHSMIAHKETRFMFPMFFAVFYLAVLGWSAYGTETAKQRWFKIAWGVTMTVNVIALLFRCFYPANDLLPFTRFMRAYSAEHPGATIYWKKVGKYKKETLTPHFYETPWMHIEVLDSLQQLDDRALYRPKSGDLIYFRTEDTSYVPQGFQTEKVYQWYPPWLLKLNFNHWVERTRIWSVYRLK